MSSEYMNAISTHTFMWPFTYKKNDKESEYRPSQHVWYLDNAFATGSGDEYMDAYMMAQYFNAQAREIFTGFIKDVSETCDDKDTSPCKRYLYDLGIVKKLKYLIEPKEGQSYELSVHAVRMYLFGPFGVGVLSIETYNRKYRSLKDIQRINDLGRRIRLPFLPRTSGGYILCAEKIGIVYDNDERWVTNYRRLADEAVEEAKNGSVSNREKFLKPADFIYGFLSGGIGIDDNSRCLPEGLEPASDDRMFLVSLLKDKKLSSSIKNWRNPNECDYNLLYSIVFADPNSYPTCQDEKMRTELLEKAVYPRWSNEGTLYAITNLSVMCLTDEKIDIVDNVYRPFLTEYTAMALLVLAQRVSIERFARDSSGIVRGAAKRGLLSTSQIKDMINLHECYVTWQNQINLFEMTDQEQGIEMYEQMREQMGVDERIGYLAEQLEDMYAIANVNQNTIINRSVIWWAFAALVVNICLSFASFLLELTESGKGIVGGTEESWSFVWNLNCSSGLWWIQPLSVIIVLCAVLRGLIKSWRRYKQDTNDDK